MIKEFIENLSEYENTTNEYIKRYKTFDEFLNSISREVVIFGTSTLEIFLLECLKSKNVNVKFFSDNDKNKQGKLIEGIPVEPPSKIDIKDVVLVASGWEYEIYKQLVEMGIRDVIPYGKFQFKSNVENIEWLYQNLEDEESKEILLKILEYRLTGTINFKPSRFKQYFHPKASPERGDIVIDAGAYVGDTAIEFCKSIDKIKIYCFEPDPINYLKMIKNIHREQLNDFIEPINAALSYKDGFMWLTKSKNPAGNFISRSYGDTKINVVSIDSSFKDIQNLQLIKMDIEGSELNALKGAYNLIKKYTPKLQICLYHKPSDLWEIPIYIKTLSYNYDFFIGHHSYNWTETVLYAYAV